jgi:hypothetical protein
MNHNMPAADRLRKAARILRQRATAATPPADPYPGGWSGYGITDHTNPQRGELYRSALYAGPAEDGYRTGVVVEVKEDCDAACCGCIPMSQADSDYIATVNPGVGLVLASALDNAAGNADYATSHGFGQAGLTADLLTVADQILGLPAEQALAEHRAAYEAAMTL